MAITLTLVEVNIHGHKHGYNHGYNLKMKDMLENPLVAK